MNGPSQKYSRDSGSHQYWTWVGSAYGCHPFTDTPPHSTDVYPTSGMTIVNVPPGLRMRHASFITSMIGFPLGMCSMKCDAYTASIRPLCRYP